MLHEKSLRNEYSSIHVKFLVFISRQICRERRIHAEPGSDCWNSVYFGASRFHQTCSSKVDGVLDYVEVFFGARWDYHVDPGDTLGKI